MASLTRSELKDIVKECIVEVLLEGLKSDPTPRNVQEQARKPAPVPVGKKHLDSVTFSAGASRVAEQAQGRRAVAPPAVTALTAEFPKEQRDVMQSIFEDTARNTLPAQMTAERNPSAAMAQMSGTPDVDPMSLFEGASNWAELAFASSKSR